MHLCLIYIFLVQINFENFLNSFIDLYIYEVIIKVIKSTI